MYTVTKSIEFDAAHRVPDHKSKCRNLHGHRYKVEATALFTGVNLHREGSDNGMVVDFGDLKQIMMENIHNVFDHGAVFFARDPLYKVWDTLHDVHGMKVYYLPAIPTAENLAAYFWVQITDHPLYRNQQLWTCSEVAVWETPTSVARFKP